MMNKRHGSMHIWESKRRKKNSTPLAWLLQSLIDWSDRLYECFHHSLQSRRAPLVSIQKESVGAWMEINLVISQLRENGWKTIVDFMIVVHKVKRWFFFFQYFLATDLNSKFNKDWNHERKWFFVFFYSKLNYKFNVSKLSYHQYQRNIHFQFQKHFTFLIRRIIPFKIQFVMIFFLNQITINSN